MSTEKMRVHAVDPAGKWLYRVGGICALVLGIAYLITIPLYAHVGAPPSGGEAWLKYLAEKTTKWWTILGLSVFTDLLSVPVALALYLALQGVTRSAMLVATAFVGLFIVLDLAVTWTNYASLLTLSGNYAAATNDAQRVAACGSSTQGSSGTQATRTILPSPSATPVRSLPPTSTASAQQAPALHLNFTCNTATGSESGPVQVCVKTQPGASLTIKMIYCDTVVDSSGTLKGTFVADANGDYFWKWSEPKMCNGQAIWKKEVDDTATFGGQSISIQGMGQA